MFWTDPPPGPYRAVPRAVAVPFVPVGLRCNVTIRQACSHQMKRPPLIPTCAIHLLGNFRQGTPLLCAPIPLLPSISLLHLKCKGSQSQLEYVFYMPDNFHPDRGISSYSSSQECETVAFPMLFYLLIYSETSL